MLENDVFPKKSVVYKFFKKRPFHRRNWAFPKAQPKAPLPKSALRRKWGLAPLCGAVVTFSHYSKGPSRP